jgi:hypothetical protein
MKCYLEKHINTPWMYVQRVFFFSAAAFQEKKRIEFY